MSYHSSLGRYELIGQLATGGMAEIHLARLAGEAGFEKVVVVKRLLPELVASKAFVAMFLDEAKLVARLDHPNVCEVYELGRDGAEYFIVMPYLDGIPASALHADARVAAGVVVQACAGLHYAHERGIVHRDVSPSNLFVTASGLVKVLDFGIAKVRGANETEVGTIKGKTQYMAPEQLLGEQLDRRADVFALGIVLWELVTHRRLFERASDYLVAKAVLEEPIPRADGALADVIARALERDRDKRFADARELARAIEEAMAAHGGVASGDEIASALRDAHGDALEAQRTRQLHVLSGAKSSGAKSSGGDSVATDSHEAATTPRAIAEPRAAHGRRVRMLALGAGAAVLAVGGAVAWKLSSATPGPASGGSDAVVRGSDAIVRGAAEGSADVRAAELPGQGSAGQGMRRTDGGHGSRPRHSEDEARNPPPKGQGTFSIDSTPFATIYVDDRMVGITPMIHRPLGAGHHKLRAVLEDGRSRDLELDVPVGKPAAPINLTW